jgi:hypothetical protein
LRRDRHAGRCGIGGGVVVRRFIRMSWALRQTRKFVPGNTRS